MTGIVQSLIGSFGSVVSAVTDAYFNLVTLLLPGNGTNGAQNNTFLDSSSNNFTITRNGNTTQGTFSPFSQTGWSNNFASSSTDMLSTASNAAFAFGTGDFTMEAFVFATASQTDNWIIGLANNCWLRVGSAGKLEFYNNVAATSILASSAMPTNQWVHVAAVRSGTTLTIYQNGTSVASGTVSTNFSTNVACTVGNQSGVDRRWNGYLSNVRVVKGTAVYTSAFTPPTSALTAITNTSLLTCQDNRFIDNSSNAFAITVNGTPSVQAFSPFAPTAAYSASTNGGSGYFDGTGDYLSASNATAFLFGTGDFTAEAFVYPTSFPAEAAIITTATTTDFQGFTLNVGTSGNIILAVGAGGSWAFTTSAGGTLTVGQWQHIALTRSGNVFRIFVNGTQTYTNTNSVSLTNSNNAINVGGRTAGGGQYFNGYISNARILKGTAQYTANFTPPTAPLTAITNTQLLLNYTNAGITDATAKNDLETVGNAQISTTQSKFGGSSMYFDGTGDWIVRPHSPLFEFGSGDFTIEFWAYASALSGAYTGVVCVWEGGAAVTDNSWNVLLNSFNATNKFGFSYTQGSSSIDIIFNATTSTGSWDHYAIVRSGGTIYGFKNGVSQAISSGSSTISGSINNGTKPFYVGTSGTVSSGTSFNGYIDDLRITRYARYTANFTPPTAAFALQ